MCTTDITLLITSIRRREIDRLWAERSIKGIELNKETRIIVWYINKVIWLIDLTGRGPDWTDEKTTMEKVFLFQSAIHLSIAPSFASVWGMVSCCVFKNSLFTANIRVDGLHVCSLMAIYELANVLSRLYLQIFQLTT